MNSFILFKFCIFLHISISSAYFNNTCLLKTLNQFDNNTKPRTFDCCRFVLKTTDEIWNGDRTESSIISNLKKYMTNDWESVSIYGKYAKGQEDLQNLVLQTLKAFPDIKLHMTDCFCKGNDIDGYKSTMPVIHTATHTGYNPDLGPPTGKYASWLGIPNSYIKKFPDGWKYTAEWNMPDAWSLYKQLNINPSYPSKSPLKISDCEQIFDIKTGKLNKKLIPEHENIDMVYDYDEKTVVGRREVLA